MLLKQNPSWGHYHLSNVTPSKSLPNLLKYPLYKRAHQTQAPRAQIGQRPPEKYINIMTSRFAPSGRPSGDEAYFKQLGVVQHDQRIVSINDARGGNNTTNFVVSKQTLRLQSHADNKSHLTSKAHSKNVASILTGQPPNSLTIENF